MRNALFAKKKKMVTCKLLQDSHVKLFVARTKKLSEQKKKNKNTKKKNTKKEKVAKLSKAVSFRHLAWLFEFPFKKKEFKEIQQTFFLFPLLQHFSSFDETIFWSNRNGKVLNYFLVDKTTLKLNQKLFCCWQFVFSG